MNEILEIMKNRASCRNFSNSEVDESVLNRILEAGISAPTGGDLQPFSIIKIRDAESKEMLCKLSKNQKYIARAPVNLLFCVDWRRVMRMAEIESCPIDLVDQFFDYSMSLIDVSLCAQNVCIAAESMGLKSIFIGNIFSHLHDVSEHFGLPKYVFPVMVMGIGYPASNVKVQKKYPLEVIVHDEMYHDMDDEALTASFKERYSDWKIKVNDDKMKVFLDRCESIRGPEFRKKAEEGFSDQNKLNFYQFWIGIFYETTSDMMNNHDFKSFMSEKGFGWLEL